MLNYDAWTSGLVLAPGGLGTMIALMISGRLISRVDQRLLLGFGCGLNIVAVLLMTNLTLELDYWGLAWPRFLQGFAMGFVFPPLQVLALATISLDRLGNATAAYNVVRNVGGSIGVALFTTLLARRSQGHQAALVAHVNPWDPETAQRLADWAHHFRGQGADTFTASRQALAMLYRGAVDQAHVLAYIDDFWLIAVTFIVLLPLIPLMRRVRTEENERARGERVEPLPVPEE